MSQYRNRNNSGRNLSERGSNRSNRDENNSYNREHRESNYERSERNNNNRYHRGRYGNSHERDISYNIEDKIRERQVQEYEHQQIETKELNDTNNIPLTMDDIKKREECLIPVETFDELSNEIDLKIIRGVMAYGFETPSLIQ